MNAQDEEPDSPDDYLRRLQQESPAAAPPTSPYPVQHYGYAPLPPPEHASATTAMVLGIIGLGSIVVACGVGLVLSPIAWVMGTRALREIDADPGRYSGRDKASTGRITGIIGTILLVLGLVFVVLAVIALVMLPAQVVTDQGNV